MRPLTITFLALLPLVVATASSQDERPNLLLITVDTLRADYLGVNGATEGQTPNLDRLAASGVNFTRTRSSAPLTLPSHASIFTADYPPTHGVRDNGTYRLADTKTTLAEILKMEGYTTAAFVGAFVLDHRFGLAQGFDAYDDRTWSSADMLESLEAERPAGEVHHAFARWLSVYGSDSPFFVWIHLYDPHAPYTPPEPYRSRCRENPYAGEVAYTDAVIGRVLSELETRGVLERTLIAVVGDHGEGLGEHDEMTHSLLIYNATIHVPMILTGTDRVPAGRRVDTLTRTIDLAPTLLDYLDISTKLGEGISLRARIEGEPSDEEPTAYSESLYPRLNLGWSELRALEVGKYRFILAPHPELFDLGDDPGETTNRANVQPRIARQLERKLQEPTVEETGETVTLDAETEAKLRSLGYVSSSRARVKEESSETRTDPKSNMKTWHSLKLAMSQFGMHDYQGSVRTLRSILASEKDIPVVYEYLGSSHMRLEDYRGAESVYRQALERGIESPDFHLNLGVIHFHRNELGDLTRAAKELQIALALDPLSVAAHYRLGDVFRRAGKFERAVEEYRAALDINPSYVYALNGLGMSYVSLGRNTDASEVFRSAVQLYPKEARGHFNLAVQLERMEQNQEALAAYKTFMSFSTDEELPRERTRARAAIDRLARR